MNEENLQAIQKELIEKGVGKDKVEELSIVVACRLAYYKSFPREYKNLPDELVIDNLVKAHKAGIIAHRDGSLAGAFNREISSIILPIIADNQYCPYMTKDAYMKTSGMDWRARSSSLCDAKDLSRGAVPGSQNVNRYNSRMAGRSLG